MSTAKHELLLLKGSLTKAIQAEKPAEGEIYDMIQALKRILMTEELLRETKVGVLVNDVKKLFQPTHKVHTDCKNLVADWKKCVASLKAQSEASSSTSSSKKAVNDEADRKSSRPKTATKFYKDEVPQPATHASDKQAPVPSKNAKGELVFADFPHFRPNLTPKEVR